MASGSPAVWPSNSGSKGFDFATDDVLLSYQDYTNQDPSNAHHSSDPVTGTSNHTKDFQKTRMTKSTVMSTSNGYARPEGFSSQELLAIVDMTTKKYADNLMHVLEGISSRLSQLELYCYNLDKSMGEMKSEFTHDHEEADAKLRSVDKHLQEVRRSVQILRDKQELAETQKELAKLHFVQKETVCGGGCSHHEERNSTVTNDSRKQEDTSEMHNLQLALALPPPLPSHLPRVAGQQQSVGLPSQAVPQTLTSQQQTSYYISSSQLPNPLAQSQSPQGPYFTPDSQYRASNMAPNPQQSQSTQSPAVQQFPQYQQQWAQPVLATHPTSQVQSQNQMRTAVPPPSTVCVSYITSQPTNPSSQDSRFSSIPMQVPLSGTGIPQPVVVSRAESVPYGYGGGTVRTLHSQPPPQHTNTPQHSPHPAISSGGSYVVYDNDAPHQHHPSLAHFSQGGGYPQPAGVSMNNPHPQPPPTSNGGLVIRGPSPQLVRSHPHGELIDKMVSMGYRGDHVASVIQRLEESGQPGDYNTVLDRLNGHSSGVPQRVW